jgi:hypothetical protein
MTDSYPEYFIALWRRLVRAPHTSGQIMAALCRDAATVWGSFEADMKYPGYADPYWTICGNF